MRLEDSPISEWQKHKMHDPDEDGFVALHYAVQHQDVGTVERLLEDKCGKMALYERSTLDPLHCHWNIWEEFLMYYSCKLVMRTAMYGCRPYNIYTVQVAKYHSNLM